MKFEGGCYCKAVRYEAEGEPMMQAQCHFLPIPMFRLLFLRITTRR